MIQNVEYLFCKAYISMFGVGSASPAVPPYKVGVRGMLQLPYCKHIETGIDGTYLNGDIQSTAIVVKPEESIYADIEIEEPEDMVFHALTGAGLLPTTNGTSLSAIRDYQNKVQMGYGFYFKNPINYIETPSYNAEGLKTTWGYYLLDSNDNIVFKYGLGAPYYKYLISRMMTKDNSHAYGTSPYVEYYNNTVNYVAFYEPFNTMIFRYLLGFGIMPDALQSSTATSLGTDPIDTTCTNYSPVNSVDVICTPKNDIYTGFFSDGGTFPQNLSKGSTFGMQKDFDEPYWVGAINGKTMYHSGHRLFKTNYDTMAVQCPANRGLLSITWGLI